MAQFDGFTLDGDRIVQLPLWRPTPRRRRPAPGRFGALAASADSIERLVVILVALEGGFAPPPEPLSVVERLHCPRSGGGRRVGASRRDQAENQAAAADDDRPAQQLGGESRSPSSSAPMATATTVTRNSTLIATVAPASATSRKYRTYASALHRDASTARFR